MERSILLEIAFQNATHMLRYAASFSNSVSGIRRMNHNPFPCKHIKAFHEMTLTFFDDENWFLRIVRIWNNAKKYAFKSNKMHRALCDGKVILYE